MEAQKIETEMKCPVCDTKIDVKNIKDAIILKFIKAMKEEAQLI